MLHLTENLRNFSFLSPFPFLLNSFYPFVHQNIVEDERSDKEETDDSEDGDEEEEKERKTKNGPVQNGHLPLNNNHRKVD